MFSDIFDWSNLVFGFLITLLITIIFSSIYSIKVGVIIIASVFTLGVLSFITYKIYDTIHYRRIKANYAVIRREEVLSGYEYKENKINEGEIKIERTIFDLVRENIVLIEKFLMYTRVEGKEDYLKLYNIYLGLYREVILHDLSKIKSTLKPLFNLKERDKREVFRHIK